MDIRESTAAGAARSDILVQPVRATVPAQPVRTAEGRPALEPAVQVELSEAARGAGGEPRQASRQFNRDPATDALVYQVVDQVSGEVLTQLPDEATLKARLYARELEARAGGETAGSTVAVA